MKKYLLKIILINFLFFTSCKTTDKTSDTHQIQKMIQSKKTISNEIIRSVVKITNLKTNSTGTGFLVYKYTDKKKNIARVYLVTNKHVIGNWSPFNSDFQLADVLDIKLYVEDKNHSVVDLLLELKDKNGKKFEKIQTHPDHLVDIAVIDMTQSINLLRSKNIKDNFSSISTSTLLPLEDISKTTSSSMGDKIFAIGYPSGIILNNSNEPIAKSGHIASRLSGNLSFDLRAQNSRPITLSKKFFLVDGLIIPGNSGGPIITPNRHIILSPKSDGKFRTLEHNNFVIGIVSMRTGIDGVSIAYSMDYVLDIINNFKIPEE